MSKSNDKDRPSCAHPSNNSAAATSQIIPTSVTTMNQPPTTINQMPQEVFYMILDDLTREEKLECRFVSKQFMRVASYIFKKIKFNTREHVTFFAEAIKKNDCIAAHVQSIQVKTAALLRAINQTNIKKACYNVKEIEILEKQGNGAWGTHLAPYPNIQHPPVLMDQKNADIVLENYKDQLMTLRLGGEYLENMTRDDVAQVVRSTPNIRTFGLHYLFKAKNRDIHRDLPHSWTFDDLNYILRQPSNMHRFELHHCEIADESLIGAGYENMALLTRLRQIRANPPLYGNSLLDANPHLTHIEIKQILVTNVGPFVRSILDSYVNLESLDITFVHRNNILENTVGSQWDLSLRDPWSRDLQHVSKLKKLALTAIQQRLSVPLLLELLGKAQAPLQEIYIVDSNGNREDVIMDYICQNFSTTLKRLTIDNKARCNLTRLDSLLLLEYASFHYKTVGFDRFMVRPHQVLENCPQMKQLSIGYIDSNNTMHLEPLAFTNRRAFVNVTSISLSCILINENEIKTLLLPLIHLKEAIFSKCLFELENEDGHGDSQVEEDEEEGLTTALDRRENFDFLPSSGDIEDKVRKEFFTNMNVNEIAFLVAAERRKRRTMDASSSSTTTPAAPNPTGK